MGEKSRTLLLALSVTLSAIGMQGGWADEASDIAALRAAAEKYQDVNVALADGYVPDPSGHCIDAAAEGLPPEWAPWVSTTSTRRFCR